MIGVRRALLCGWIVVASGCVTAVPGPAGADREELIGLNRHLFERMMLHHDTEPYGDVALPEFVFIANIGIVETKEDVVSTPENLAIERVAITNEEVRIVGDTAVLVGRMEVRGTVLGFPLPEEMRYMSVFVRTGGRWRLLAESLTPVADPRTMRAE